MKENLNTWVAIRIQIFLFQNWSGDFRCHPSEAASPVRLAAGSPGVSGLFLRSCGRWRKGCDGGSPPLHPQANTGTNGNSTTQSEENSSPGLCRTAIVVFVPAHGVWPWMAGEGPILVERRPRIRQNECDSSCHAWGQWLLWKIVQAGRRFQGMFIFYLKFDYSWSHALTAVISFSITGRGTPRPYSSEWDVDGNCCHPSKVSVHSAFYPFPKMIPCVRIVYRQFVGFRCLLLFFFIK